MMLFALQNIVSILVAAIAIVFFAIFLLFFIMVTRRKNAERAAATFIAEIEQHEVTKDAAVETIKCFTYDKKLYDAKIQIVMEPQPLFGTLFYITKLLDFRKLKMHDSYVPTEHVLYLNADEIMIDEQYYVRYKAITMIEIWFEATKKTVFFKINTIDKKAIPVFQISSYDEIVTLKNKIIAWKQTP